MNMYKKKTKHQLYSLEWERERELSQWIVASWDKSLVEPQS